MKWLMVGKTVVPFDPEGRVKPMFVLINESAERPVRRFPSIDALAVAVLASKRDPVDVEVRLIKNDVPSIVWLPNDTLADTFLECERLEKQELRDLVRLLRG